MKKKILIVIGVLSLFLFLFPESKVSASVTQLSHTEKDPKGLIYQ